MKRISVKHIVLLFLSTYILTNEFAWSQSFEPIQTQNQYQDFIYPYNDTWTSTLTFALLRPKKLVFKSDAITLYPERDALPFVGNSNHASYGIYLAKNKTAPLVFILPGAGGNALEMGALYLAEILNNNGFSVITLPSTFNFRFALAISRSGLPGHVQTDTEDLYRMMKVVYQKVSDKYKLKPTSINLLGYSYGARDAAFLNLVDQREHGFNFKRIYYINPPLHIHESLLDLDKLFNIGLAWKETTRNNLIEYIFGKLSELLDHQLSIKEYSRIDQNFQWENKPFSTEMKQWIIGLSYRKSLRDLIFTSQLINDLGVQKVPVSESLRDKRYEEAMQYSFEHYLGLFLLPKIKKDSGITTEDFFNTADFQYAAEKSKSTTITAIAHNSNDFLIHPEDASWIQEFSSESKVFNYGGHLGNLWVPENMNHMLQFFRPLLNN